MIHANPNSTLFHRPRFVQEKQDCKVKHTSYLNFFKVLVEARACETLRNVNKFIIVRNSTSIHILSRGILSYIYLYALT